ncbi:hypothetical protein LOY69_14360 [Pseudomonas sp. B21-059]|uniref:hypothetical protein n=1 Tax=Pseudomonas sp. B21-059 TaxID=2895496 RepID=UPI0022344B6F|nr:hypothetical protein [Pseudomonas sp. B21-059]UZE37624.1 hypothetical protein LOY69_14360 [Pseudomonas sp. B21-059]
MSSESIAIPIEGVNKFYLVGTASGQLGKILVGERDEDKELNSAFVEIARVVGPCPDNPPDASTTAACNFFLTSPLRIPGTLIHDSKKRFLNSAELKAEIATASGTAVRQFVALVQDTVRRMQSIEVDARAQAAAFLGSPLVNAFAGGHIRMQLWTVDPTVADDPVTLKADMSIELAAYVSLMTATLKRSVALTVIVDAAVGASLRIDADDLGLRFPTFNLPHFDLGKPMAPLALRNALTGAESTLRRLVDDANITVELDPPTASQPKLFLKLRSAGPGIDWVVVTGDFNPDVDLDPVAKAAVFTVNVALPGGAGVRIEQLTLGDVANKQVFGGTVKAVMQPIDIPLNAPHRFGPFEFTWAKLTVTPSHQGNAFGKPAPPDEGETLRAVISFERLMLRVTDDPDAFLTVTGQVEIDPSGARLLALELVEPFPLVLLQNAAQEMLRGGAAVMNIIIDTGTMLRAHLETLLDMLARMALATGRAAIFLADKVGGALDALGDLLSSGLGGIAEMVAALLRGFKDLALSPSTTPPFTLELRIGTHPFELRQVLVTSRTNGNNEERNKALLGFTLKIPGHWQPGLLLDFVTQPGAYLVLTCDTPPPDNESAKVASLHTDLWLDRTDNETHKTDSRPLRDVDGKNSVPQPRTLSDEPLLGLNLKLKEMAEASQLILVVAGLTRGHTVFFMRMAGATTTVQLPGNPGMNVRSVDGPFRLVPLEQAFDLDVEFKADRILPLLGMGESGADPTPGAGPGFLDKLKGSLANVVWVKESRPYASLSNRNAGVELVLGLKAAGLETSLALKAQISLDSLAVTLETSDEFTIASQRIEENALGLLWVIEQADADERKSNAKIDMFKLGFAGGQSGFELNAPKPGEEPKNKARMQLRFNGLSSDGQGVVFEVTTFKIGPGGLDLVAKVADNPVRLSGIDVPFHFNDGTLEIKGGRLVRAMIAGRGALPPDLVGEADCTVALTFAEVEGEGIVLQSGKVELDKKSDPIICHTSRFTLTISDLDIAFVKDGGYHFYYLVTGSLRFTPKPGEFESGLLQYLDGVEMNLERTPLSADPSVLLKHISFQKTLNPKKSFNLFNLFTFELRGFGYHPASPKFDGDPAVNISGQIQFVEIGDVMAPSIDFHGLWIAPPKEGESLPRIKADGLGIDLNLKGAIRVRGSVIAVDADTRTVEGKELAPPDYNAYGFLGRGEFDIPGWGAMGASLGFLELEHKDRPGERRKSFFFYADKKKLAIEIPTVVWNFYLREAGFGLGFRYTLDAIDAADRATSIPKLVSALDEVSKTQGDLHKFSAWKPEFEGDRVTLALKGAIQVYPASKNWDEEAENAAQNPFLFDLVAAIRSDFTLFMGLRGWVGTNYIDYLNDKDGLRSKPGLRGYLYISAPQQRLLARMIGDSKGYIGERIPALQKGAPMRTALQSVDWSATLFIKPGLFHYELGWPNQLVVRLMDEENMRVTVRGGMIFRAAEDGLLWGYNIEADAFFRFGGEFQAGPVGVCAEATLRASLVARVLCYLTWRVSGSLIYGLIALDAELKVSFRAWLEVDLGITSFTLRIGFSQTLQFSAAVEIALSTEGVGARVAARVAVSVFGCTLSVSVGFTLGKGQLDDARARVQRFLAMSITAEEPDAAPAALARSGDERTAKDAAHAQASASAPAPSDIKIPNNTGNPKPDSQRRSQFGLPPCETDFWCVLHQASIHPRTLSPLTPEDGFGYALLTPKEATKRDNQLANEPPFKSAFYAPATGYVPVTGFIKDNGARDETRPAHFLLTGSLSKEDIDLLQKLYRYNAASGEFESFVIPPAKELQEIEVRAKWNNPVQTEDGLKKLTLALLFDECYLTDTTWFDAPTRVPPVPNEPPYRRSSGWHEPKRPRIHANPKPAPVGTEQERNSERDLFQRGHAAETAANPVVDGVHQARSTVLAMFAEQFVALTASTLPSNHEAHVADLGLVFFGPVKALEKLALLGIRKDEPDEPKPAAKITAGKIEVFNPFPSWFVEQDPMLTGDRSTCATDGVKLDWQLTLPFAQTIKCDAATPELAPQANPDQFLKHYEIVRTLEGHEFTPRTVLVKPAATLGGVDLHGVVSQLAPDWQYTDDLSDLNQELRRALLPSNDEAGTFEGATAWARTFADRESISLSYTVTPVDSAGSRGMPKSFLVDIPRPLPPLRPAEAELRVIIKRMGPGQYVTTPHHKEDMPDKGSIAILMALRDPAGEANARRKDNVTVVRKYHLVADPENISPSGHYGTDGLTERRPGLAATFNKSGDERVWELKRDSFVDVRLNDKIPADSFIDPIEPDHQTLETYPLWSLLSGTTDIGRVDEALGNEHIPLLVKPKDNVGFLESLWRRGGAKAGARIATRFALETVQMTTVQGADGKPHTFTTISKRVPVNIEVRIEPLDLVRNDIGLLRPDAFEWPVHLDLPPHGPGQLQASSGFARFLAPPHQGGLDKLLEPGGVNACVLVRDPERRILTEVSFDAVPDFVRGNGADVDRIHASSIAGFDLHELDLDDLAPLDTALAPEFDRNADTWRRARRVARIERVSPEMARLLPDSNKDWPGWQAHYPSETWRLALRAQSRSGQSVPRRAPWYSAAESTVAFAARVPRMRVFATASEAAVTDLMSHGQPDRIYVSFSCTTAADAQAWLKLLAKQLNKEAHVRWGHLNFGEATFSKHLELLAKPSEDEPLLTLTAPDGASALSTARVRAALLGLLLKVPPTAVRQMLGALAGGTLLTCSIRLEARSWVAKASGGMHDQLCGEAVLPLTLTGTLHPILEEVVGELEYSSANEGLYRRYVVAVQPVQPVAATTMAAFLADSNNETDPYGWAALQQLGLASTIKMYDRDMDRFLSAEELLGRVHNVFKSTVSRYSSADGEDGYDFGQPFVDVLLRPGRDRTPGPFDAVLASAGVELEHGRLELDSDGLSIAQLSLRPVPAPARRYFFLDMRWEKGYWPEQLEDASLLTVKVEKDPDGTWRTRKTVSATRMLLGYEVVFTVKGMSADLTSMQDGRTSALQPAVVERLALNAFPKGLVSTTPPALALQFFLRSSDQGDFAQPDISLVARVRMVTSTTTETFGHAGSVPTMTTETTSGEQFVPFEELKTFVVPPAGAKLPTSGLISPSSLTPAFVEICTPDADGPSPYERFRALAPDEWADELAQAARPKAAFLSLRDNLRFAAPALAWPGPTWADDVETKSTLEIAAAYLPWTQRFLDHAAAPGYNHNVIQFALAAPVKANPLNLAADDAGRLTLSFLHADRWAHARVYAVRATPRYQNQALGAGYYKTQGESEQLVTDGLLVESGNQAGAFKRAIGYALAVSERTERIEPPVILGSRLVRRDYTVADVGPVAAGQWELILARHGEEGLAFSNRPLYARLGTQGTALSFVREYRDPDWPATIAGALRPPADLQFTVYPERLPTLAAIAMDDSRGIDGTDLGELAGLYPSLWKGADVWRVSHLPAHYRVTALAVARAGVVVSRVISTVQDATPRRPLALSWRVQQNDVDKETAALGGTPELTITRLDKHSSAIHLSGLRMISHADLSEVGAHAWFSGGELDVAWCPDPNVRYTLLRRGHLGGGRSFEDQDAEVTLIAHDPVAEGGQVPRPIVLRCRGTRFATIDGEDGEPRMSHSVVSGRLEFHLSARLQLAPNGLAPEQRRIRLPRGAEQAVTQAFNAAASNFAEIKDIVLLAVGPFVDLPDGRDATQAWLLERAHEIEATVDSLEPKLDADLQPACTALRTIARSMEMEANALPPVPDYDPEKAALQRQRTIEVELLPLALDPLVADSPFPLIASTTGVQLLTLYDLPVQAEAAAAWQSGHPAAQRGTGQLWQACRERLLGAGSSMALRVVDTRNAIEREALGKGWVTPGEMEVPVGLPTWTKWASEVI